MKPSYNATNDPIGFLKESVLPGLKENVDKKNLNQVTTSVIGASSLLSFKTGNATGVTDQTENSAEPIVRTLIKSTAGLDATSVETIEQILSAFTAVSDNSKSEDIQSESRNDVFNSLEDLVNLTALFTYEGLSLHEAAYDNFVNLLGSNIQFDKTLQKPSTRKRRAVDKINTDDTALGNVNYVLLQRVYDLALNTTMKGEEPKILKGPFITANLERRTGSMDRSAGRSVGDCFVSYNVERVKTMDEVIEIAECSSVNPFQDIPDQVGIVSLTLKDRNFTDLKLSHLPSHDINVGIPVRELQSTDHLNLSQSISPEYIIWAPIVNLTEPLGGWNHSSIHIVVDAFPGVEGSIYLHLSEGKMNNAENRDTVVKQFKSGDEETKRTVAIIGM